MASRLPIKDQAVALLHHARAATLFSSQDGELCASVPMHLDARQVVPLRSAGFRDWLIANFYGEYESAPAASAYRAALRTLEARARSGEMPAQKFDVRLGFEGDPFAPSKIMLDLANAAGEVLEIDSHGWRITDNFRHSFRQTPAMLPLPHPAGHSERSDALKSFAGLFRLSGADRARVLTWLLAALRPAGPYPMLVIQGPTASGKSCLGRALRALIDPSTAPLRRLPQRDRELLEYAHQNWMLAFDPVYRAAPDTAEAPCALSSGQALEIAQPDSRHSLVFELARPIVLIVPSDETQPAWAPPRTLRNRTIAIRLAAISKLRAEAALWADFEALRKGLLGALAGAVVTALERVREVDVGNVVRFPDTAIWAAAAAPALDLTESEAVAAVTDPDAIWIGADPLREALYTLLQSNSAWTGDATALLQQLRAVAPLAKLPAPTALSQALAGIAGIQITKGQGGQGQRVFTIIRTGQPAQQSAAGDGSAVLPSL